MQWVVVARQTTKLVVYIANDLIYANSITLTPGTITTDLNSTRIQIHALGEGAEKDIRTGKMAAKIAVISVPR